MAEVLIGFKAHTLKFLLIRKRTRSLPSEYIKRQIKKNERNMVFFDMWFQREN